MTEKYRVPLYTGRKDNRKADIDSSILKAWTDAVISLEDEIKERKEKRAFTLSFNGKTQTYQIDDYQTVCSDILNNKLFADNEEEEASFSPILWKPKKTKTALEQWQDEIAVSVGREDRKKAELGIAELSIGDFHCYVKPENIERSIASFLQAQQLPEDVLSDSDTYSNIIYNKDTYSDEADELSDE